MAGNGTKEKEKSLKVRLENQKLVRGFANKITNYCHLYLRRRGEKKDDEGVKNVLIFRKNNKVVYKDKQHDLSPE